MFIISLFVRFFQILIWITYPDGQVVDGPINLGDTVIFHASIKLKKNCPTPIQNLSIRLGIGDIVYEMFDDLVCPDDVKFITSSPHKICKADVTESNFLTCYVYINNDIDSNQIWEFWRMEETTP